MGKNTIFLNEAEEDLIAQRIAAVERQTSGEVHVHLASGRIHKGIMEDAAYVFQQLGLDRTRQRNGVLIYVAVAAHQFAILGDEGIHRVLGQEGWDAEAAKLHEAFAKGDFGPGLLAVIDDIGAVLTKHFPAVAGEHNPDELPNAPSRS